MRRNEEDRKEEEDEEKEEDEDDIYGFFTILNSTYNNSFKNNISYTHYVVRLDEYTQ